MLKRALCLPLILLTFSCGGPEFSISYRYIPPKNNGNCLEKCQEEFSNCQLECSKKRNGCLEKVRLEAQKLYQKELEIYQREISAYNKDYTTYQRRLLEWNRNYRNLYRDYLYFKKACKKSRDYFACNRKEELEEALETLNQVKPQPPVKPNRPSFSSIVNRLSLTCPTECGCKEEYNTCYTSCGGQIIPERICVKNCK